MLMLLLMMLMLMLMLSLMLMKIRNLLCQGSSQEEKIEQRERQGRSPLRTTGCPTEHHHYFYQQYYSKLTIVKHPLNNNRLQAEWLSGAGGDFNKGECFEAGDCWWQAPSNPSSIQIYLMLYGDDMCWMMVPPRCHSGTRQRWDKAPRSRGCTGYNMFCYYILS